MKAVEFESELSATGKIEVPPEALRQLPSGERLRVIVLLEGEEDSGWEEFVRRKLADAYAPEDSVYESLMDETSER